jgi:MoaA/NifB/PqqE/SkfB family radical SAM enzyme
VEAGVRKRKGYLDGALLLNQLLESRAKAISLRGGGEPTLHTKFDWIAREAHAAGIKLGLITNGTNSLDASLFDWIRVSLDATNPEDYLEWKGRDFFDTVVGHVREWAQKTRVGLTFIGRPTLDVAAAKDLAVELCTDHVVFKKAFGTDASWQSLEYLDDGNYPVGNGGLPCLVNSFVSRWGFDGNVHLCWALKEKLPPLGNLNDLSFAAIWQGEEHRKQIKAVLDPNYTKVTCPDCRFSSYNQKVAEIKVRDEFFV